MYRASDRVANEEWLEELHAAAADLDFDAAVTARAEDLFLSSVPDENRSKRPVLAASLYVAALAEGDSRSQQSVADAAGVSRLSVQQRWKDLLEEAGLEPPGW